MNKLANTGVIVGFLSFLAIGQNAGATNYFSWGIESLRPSWGVNGTASYDVKMFANSTRDCTVSHSGSCSMKMVIAGNDSGNQSSGADLVIGPPAYPWNYVGSNAIYYRWWMKIQPGFSWGNGTAKTKSSRVLGTTYPRGYTGYLMSYGFLIGECDDVGSSLPGGGCLLADGSASNDYNLSIPYDFRSKNDGVWHEYIVKIKPNTSASCTVGINCDAEFQAWVDGVSVGQYNGFKLHNKATNGMQEAWGGWMVSPYFQMNGTSSDGGIIYLDDFSTDNSYNSLASGSSPPTGGTTLSSPTNLKAQ